MKGKRRGIGTIITLYCMNDKDIITGPTSKNKGANQERMIKL